MIDLVTSQNLPYQTIERDFNGIDLTTLERLFKTQDIKFSTRFHVFQTQLGLSYYRN